MRIRRIQFGPRMNFKKKKMKNKLTKKLSPHFLSFLFCFIFFWAEVAMLHLVTFFFLFLLVFFFFSSCRLRFLIFFVCFCFVYFFFSCKFILVIFFVLKVKLVIVQVCKISKLRVIAVLSYLFIDRQYNL
jgi:hypothetical protein